MKFRLGMYETVLKLGRDVLTDRWAGARLARARRMKHWLGPAFWVSGLSPPYETRTGLSYESMDIG